MTILRASVSLLFFFLLQGPLYSEGFSYDHLKWPIPRTTMMDESDYYIVFLVAARHLDYSDSQELFRSLVKHAAGGKNADVGHSWVLLHGIKEGEAVTIEGGQSGELGIEKPKYYDGVMNYFQYGYANPTGAQKRNPRYEPNPVKYLWADVDDGFYQEGNGTFRPSFAAKIDLTAEQFEAIYEFMSPRNYNYRHYSLVGQQCSSYLAKVATLAGLNLDHKVTVKLTPSITLWGNKVRLWSDPEYSQISFASPDALEKSLMHLCLDGKAQPARRWYKKKGIRMRKKRISNGGGGRRLFDRIIRYPYRLYRAATI